MSLQVFLVEDNPLIRENLALAMEELVNATLVGTAVSELDATAWLTTNGALWSLAVVDLFLAQGSGLGVVRSCRNRRAEQRVVVLSNYATAEIGRQAKQLGADAVFDKSTELDAFFEFCQQQAAPRH